MRPRHKIFHGNGHLLLLGRTFHIFCIYNLQYRNLYLPLHSVLYFSNPKKVKEDVYFQSCDNDVLQIRNIHLRLAWRTYEEHFFHIVAAVLLITPKSASGKLSLKEPYM